jgi:hypothetical protein
MKQRLYLYQFHQLEVYWLTYPRMNDKHFKTRLQWAFHDRTETMIQLDTTDSSGTIPSSRHSCAVITLLYETLSLMMSEPIKRLLMI